MSERLLALDTNILIHAYRNDSPLHGPASQLIRGLAGRKSAWAIPWPCIHEFLAYASHPRLGAHGSAANAIDQVTAWTESSSLHLLSETRDHWRTLASLVTDSGVAGAMIHDARIAAICLDHGVSALVTLDRDFSKFAALEIRGLDQV